MLRGTDKLAALFQPVLGQDDERRGGGGETMEDALLLQREATRTTHAYGSGKMCRPPWTDLGGLCREGRQVRREICLRPRWDPLADFIQPGRDSRAEARKTGDWSWSKTLKELTVPDATFQLLAAVGRLVLKVVWWVVWAESVFNL